MVLARTDKVTDVEFAFLDFPSENSTKVISRWHRVVMQPLTHSAQPGKYPVMLSFEVAHRSGFVIQRSRHILHAMFANDFLLSGRQIGSV